MTVKSRMVNNIPMSTIYDGMSISRLRKLEALENKAWVETYEADPLETLGDDAFMEAVEQRFAELCKRAAIKAGWHASKRANNFARMQSKKNHPSNRKTTIKKGK